MPAFAIRETPSADLPDDSGKNKRHGSGEGDGTGLDLDPLLIALLKKIPSTEKEWPGPARVRWFRTFAMNVSQIYDADGAPVEMKIELDKDEAAN